MAMNSNEFLRANWFKIASANYIVDPGYLTKFLPYGTELDNHNGNHYLSLVAFRYCNTKLLKLKVPFHTTFEEMNLRFYVKREISPGNWRKGVAFTKLFFPKNALTLVARIVYKEDYFTRKMKHCWAENDDDLQIKYGIKNGIWHNFEINAERESRKIAPDTDEDFFNNHFWGYSQINSRSATEYNIEHPEWKVHSVKDWNLKFNFKSIFGKEYNFLDCLKPSSVILTEGSNVIINKKKIII